MTTLSDATTFLAHRQRFDRRLTRAERRNIARALYRAKPPPKINPELIKANREYAQQQEEQLTASVEAENRAVAELMRTQKVMSEDGMTTSISGG